MKNNQAGFFGVFLFAVLFVGGFFLITFTGYQFANERVSGIVYNTTNDRIVSGATKFSVRASESTYTNQSNESTYCLPPGSRYIALVNQAAEDKRIKVRVVARKFFAVKAPWTCPPNVVVERVSP